MVFVPTSIHASVIRIGQALIVRYQRALDFYKTLQMFAVDMDHARMWTLVYVIRIGEDQVVPYQNVLEFYKM